MIIIFFFFSPRSCQQTAQCIKYSAFKKQMFRVEILRLNPKNSLNKRHPELTLGNPCSRLVPISEELPKIHEIFLQKKNLWAWVDHGRVFSRLEGICTSKKSIVKAHLLERAQGG